ncbi:MAG: hypothetical protein IKQ78_04410 [Bacilli bacterium]|nr:hypothetical protein [Bacilli bacterium]
MTKKSKMILGLASMLGVSAGAAAVSGFAWFTTTKKATVDVTNIGVYSKSSNLNVQYTAAVKGCIDDPNDASSVGDINIMASAEKTQNFTGDGTTTSFTLDLEPYAAPTATVDGNTTAVTWTSGKTISFASAPGNGLPIVVTYKTHSVLTDVSSVDGQKFYKPVWTAGNEGLYATSILSSALPTPTLTEGWLSFTMTLTANGSSPLKVFLNTPSITAATGATTEQQDANDAAAEIARVALIEDETHYLVLQNTSVATNNLGINQTYVNDNSLKTNGLYDLSKLAEEVDEDHFAIPNASDKSNLSDAPAENATQNYVTTVPAGASKVITVAIWLEGTSHITAYTAPSGGGSYSADPANGIFSVALPLIAF